MNKPLISIVVCTYNRGELLRESIHSLEALETGGDFDYEILIVDNNSRDNTPDVIRDLIARSPAALRTVREMEQGVVFARNRGVAEARGEWIAFFDDDQTAEPDWLQCLLALAHEKNSRCVGGAVVLRLPAGIDRNLSPVCRMLLGETVGMHHVRRYSPKVTPGCGNLMIHKSVFDEVGLFDPAFNRRGEDTDLFLRIHEQGIAAWFTPEAVIHHIIPEGRLSSEYLLKISRMMAEGMAEDEQASWGWAMYPFVWIARVGQAALVIFPRWIFARLRGDHERALGSRCRLQIAINSLRDGFALLWPRDRRMA